MHCPEVNTLITADWFKENIKFNHGELLQRYALMGDGMYIEGELYEEQRGIDNYLEKHPEYKKYDFIYEGDSPSFFYLIDFGLRCFENPTYGGWGGRFIQKNHKQYINDAFDYNPYKKQYEVEYNLERWFDDIQNDFAARADWCVAQTYEKANHAPSLTIEEGLDIEVIPRQIIQLHAKGIDPDGDELRYHWWRYFEADSYGKVLDSEIKTIEAQGVVFSKTRSGTANESILLENPNTDTVTIHLPVDMKSGDTIHIIAEVEDHGTPVVKRYQRIILTVK